MGHPPLQPGWIDAPHRHAALGRFALESGESIDDLRVSYVVHGDPDDRSKPVILGLCAIGSTHHRLDFLIGAGRAFDPSRFTIVVVDALGNGLSSSPSNSATQPRSRFPRFTIGDMVSSQKRLLEHLRIDALHTVAGASMGGMQALQWGVQFAGLMSHIVALVPMAKTAPWAQAMNHAGRLALANANPEMARGGAATDWSAWVGVMHVFANRTPQRFASDAAQAGSVDAWLQQRAQWWSAQQYDPLDWTYQSWAYDAHDVGNTPGFGGDTARALASITARTMIGVPRLDLYNPVEDGEWAAHQIPGSTLLRLPYDSGHMAASEADPAAAQFLNVEIGRFIAEA
ncbi:alpha/beta fold hydrolase [Paraburkholderia sp. SARCC-3016]|uniref:alpha/beta fold hydrolase n=1 Tax=Paraburkholderia sp. SARCC-3016 TaxID=3058611 RepID=UPI0028096D6B|nr:alpha/beta fold hydrolase [Paraburkholderia sp. SARCC-3016]MDQ7976345.1 alpha/beta fold hydrolase [Paraburkholderia sp. SARCC-3016]